MVVADLVHRDDRGGLGHAVALIDGHAEREEGARDGGAQGCAARDVEVDAVAEDGAQLAADLLVEEACDEGVEPGAGGRLDGQAVLAAEAAPAHFDGPVEEVADELGLLGEAVLQLRVDHFIDARHGHEDRGADLAEVGLQVRDGAVEGGGVA